MLKYFIFFVYFAYSAYGSGQFVVVEHPNTIEFVGKEVIDGNDIPNVIASSLGFTVSQSSEWPGMVVKSPFGFADIVSIIAVDGVASLGDFDSLPVFPVNPVQDESKLWRSLEEDVLEHYPLITNRSLLREDLGLAVNDISDINVIALDRMNDEDEDFLQDMAQYNNFIEGFKRNGVVVDDAPVVNWFTLSSLHLLSDVKGSDHEATIEAKKMVRDAVIEMGKVLKKATNGRALVAVIVSDKAHTRRARAAGDGTNSTDTQVPGNRATNYTDAYPAIFNIMLWFGIAFTFSLIAISYFIATMDPGRDSIIYRMTSNRMKKDS